VSHARATRRLGLVTTLLALAGCATVVRGTKQRVNVTSDPSAVDVIDQPSGYAFTTPSTVEMSRGQYHTLHFRKAGYEPQQVPMRREASLGFWIADAFTLGIGNLIDFATGAMFQIKPATVYAVLEPEPETQ
jgi:hypothetical protein